MRVIHCLIVNGCGECKALNAVSILPKFYSIRENPPSILDIKVDLMDILSEVSKRAS